MKYLLTLASFVILLQILQAQEKQFSIHTISLPPELSYYDNQFSGLQIADSNLYLMSESRLEDNQEAKLYSIRLSDINYKLQDTAYVLPYKKIKITGLDKLRAMMEEEKQVYEGLEAFIIDEQTVYFSVETNTPSPYCYLLKGTLNDSTIELGSTMTPIRKPRKPDGSSIYNAGFEALTLINKEILAFYEYNYFEQNFVYRYKTSLNNHQKDSLPIDKLPFRITDITPAGNNHFTAINFFYKGEGGDTVYRVPSSDSTINTLIIKGNIYHDYCRLIDIALNKNHFSWKPLWTVPPEYTGYNWEGIAAYNDGYFLINDKYTLKRPYYSALLYLK
jgi:hypothetical protein